MNDLQWALAVGGALILLLFTLREMHKRSGRDKGASKADPLAEAEVLLAYGRKKEAIALLERSWQQAPDRKDIYARLLELKKPG